jgi:uncharacterized membrane protein YhaH (DUF805 family)
MMKALFSFQGRIGVGTFWLHLILEGVLAIVGIVALLAVILAVDPQMFSEAKKEPNPAAIGVLVIGVLLIVIASNVAQFARLVKRCHDRNKSGWHSLLSFIPLFGFFWVIIDLGILSGHPGPNQYGPDPRGPAPRPPEAILDTDQFRELKILADNGLITPAEYEKRKRKLLGM